MTQSPRCTVPIDCDKTFSSKISSIVRTFLLETSFRTKFMRFFPSTPPTNHCTLGMLSKVLDGLGINS
ncbi:hypothetical protein AAJ76_226000225 [Vairimorpha ceranae]|uniref:Uncharacterized protein n=1 Tax=Vairimorpha ceranae TaxID=40302 RepID=A0A0F9W7N6_9MICR|nr:hypothetical protein AAJ76_226000225 [Vairimorpha ceranae]KKO73801.1 hypothetical protein AAJ76_226000225 [Vairimorpha ceranae]